MQCPRCGTQNGVEQQACRVCGFRFESHPLPPTGSSPENTSGRVDTLSIDSIAEAPGGTESRPPHDHNVVPYQAPAEHEVTTTERRSRVPVILAGVIALLAIVGTVVAVYVSAASPGGGILPNVAAATATSTPSSTDPVVLLDMSLKAMDDIRTLRYQSEVGFYGIEPPTPGVTSTSALSMTLSGDVELPDKYTMNTDAAELGQFIVIADTTWRRSNGNPNWVQQSTSDIGIGPVNPLAVTAYLRYYQQGTPQYVGSETRRDMVLHHIRFDVDTENMAMNTPGRAVQNLLLGSRITADVWIRDADKLLDNIALAVDMQDGRGVILRTFLSRYNAEVDIKPPEGATP